MYGRGVMWAALATNRPRYSYGSPANASSSTSSTSSRISLAVLARDAVGLEVGYLVRGAEAEEDPAAADPVEHDRVLGEPHRMVQRRRQDGGSEADPLRSLQQCGADEQRRDERAAAGLVELGQEDGVEAGLLGDGDRLPQLVEELRQVELLHLDRQDQAEAHAHE